jgi:hypothetical protein
MQQCITSLQNLKKLIYFSIWQVSKFDARVGRPDVGLPITMCVMEAGKPPQHESMSLRRNRGCGGRLGIRPSGISDQND